MTMAIRTAAAPMVAAALAFLTACGGGGGGGGGDVSSPASTATVAGIAAGSGGTGSTSPALGGSFGGQPATGAGQPAPDAEVRYTLGATTAVNETTAGTQSLLGLSATADGGFVVAWEQPFFAADGTVQRNYFERRHDSAGVAMGPETQIAAPNTPYQSSTYAGGRVPALDGGYVQFANTGDMRPGLLVQHFAADGTAADPAISLGAASHGWTSGGVALGNGAIAIAWQAVSSVGPGEISGGVLVPGAR
jgi:hypothetical protein